MVGIPTSGHRNVGGGDIVGGDIYPSLSERHHPVYCDSSNTRAMSGVGTAAGSTGVIMVVVAGQEISRPRLG